MLTQYYRSERDRASFITTLFDGAARHYDWVGHLLAFGSGPYYRRRTLAHAGLRPPMKLLDVATGTGQVARAATRILGDPRGEARHRPQAIRPACQPGAADPGHVEARHLDARERVDERLHQLEIAPEAVEEEQRRMRALRRPDGGAQRQAVDVDLLDPYRAPRLRDPHSAT